MKVRLKFTKEGPVKFVGHLDTVRLFQRAIKVAKIPVAYSQGFSPHSLIYFALPLAVGMSSKGEYLDIVLEKEIEPEWVKDQLNQVLVDGIRICEIFRAPDIKDSLMSLVKAADYQVILPKREFPYLTCEILEKGLGQQQLLVEKKGKKGNKEIDIKPLILGTEVNEEEQAFCLKLHVLAGSEANLKPELVIKALLTDVQENHYFEITREELYAYDKEYIPLDHYGR
ncbi:Fe-S oxidoreductase [Sporanaerobium hydrogeniformans]|uniref:Fe-S oxidoreductase n=1 Tax=Sporanaerobium hydrogeniformans TaxID=3072179 RepID=A0AC61DEA7_9FIRM|nr:TIGR03936 family radical SAM-associated protein [Sporanaerobium hydrogeniformans]PHV71491.1 Fe-S oxidoreductase [Sporanaerobium hydrogeniformans]